MTLRLMHFNVENLFVYMDNYSGQDLSSMSESEWRRCSSSTNLNKSLKKLWAIKNIIDEVSPDIISLNEVGGMESLKNYNDHFLSQKYSPFLIEGNSNRGIDVGYLIRQDLNLKPVLITHKNRPLNFLYPHEEQTNSGGKSHYFSRDVAELRLFKPNNNSPDLVILLAHLKSKLDPNGIDPAGRLRREAELKALLEIFSSIRLELLDKVPIVIAGDLNGTASRHNTESEFLRIYSDTELEDVLEMIDTPLENRYTQVQINHSGHALRIQLDYFLMAKIWKDMIVKSQTYVYRFKSELGIEAPVPRNVEERSNLPSDHYPVVLTIQF